MNNPVNYTLGASAPPLAEQLAGYLAPVDLERFDRMKNAIGMLLVHSIITPAHGKAARFKLAKLINAALSQPCKTDES